MVNTPKECNEVELSSGAIVKTGVIIIGGFILYGMSTVVLPILTMEKINNIQELKNAWQFVSIMSVINILGIIAGIITAIAGAAKKFPILKKIIKTITLYALFEKMVSDAVESRPYGE
jgi:uncharacterized membrane protein